MSITETINKRLEILRCPYCKNQKFGGIENIQNNTFICCNICNRKFPVNKLGYLSLLNNERDFDLKNNIQKFWGDTCKEWYSEFDNNLTESDLYDYLNDMEVLFKIRENISVTEMDLSNLSGKEILEIGSGGGSHSALFKKYGANITSVDITPERVVSTAKKLSLVKEGTGISVLADAENLPFADNSFDIVYSNGVLHHSEDTNKCIDEVLRVLKPGGKAIIMLYSRNSFLYRFILLPKAIITGLKFKLSEPEWIGYLTEGKPKTGSKNPMTRVYSRKEIIDLFCKFKIESIRKSSFQLNGMPVIGIISLLYNKIIRRKPFKSGIILYGYPYYLESKIELWIGKYIGFDMNIIAEKEK